MTTRLRPRSLACHEAGDKADIADLAEEETQMAAKSNFVLLDGLSYIEQAELANEYAERSGQAFCCLPCTAASPRGKAAEEPASEVVAVLVADTGELMPLCEACYERLIDEAREFRSGDGVMHAVKG